jgi:hypothetical protein
MGNQKKVGDVETTRADKRERVAGDGTDVGLQVGNPPVSNPRRSPHLYREKSKGAEQGTRIVDGEDGRHQPTTFLPGSDDV